MGLMGLCKASSEIDFNRKDWEDIEETIRANHKLKKPPYPVWMDLAVEDYFDSCEYNKIYDLLLKDGGQVERWSKYQERITGLPWTTYFSEFQLYLWRMIDEDVVELEVSWTYNNDMSFLSNFYNQCKYLAKNVCKREVLTNKATINSNTVDFSERADYTPDYLHSTTYVQKCKAEYEVQVVTMSGVVTETKTETVYTASGIKDRNKLAVSEMCNRGYKDEYQNTDTFTAIEESFTGDDRRILLGLATGQISKQDIPAVLGWDLTANNRMKLSRYMSKLAKVLAVTGIIAV